VYTRETSEPKELFSAETSKSITAILQEAIIQGTGTKMRTQYGIRADVAGKTGTAQNYSDAWFIAYTPNIVVGTWVGARTPDVHFFSGNGSGASLALPVAAKVLRGIKNDVRLRKKYLTSFLIPEDVYSFLQCEPMRQTGINGFFNRLFKGKNSKDAGGRTEDNKEKKRKDKKSFLERLFKGNR
jgi:penicillin-binding protein 1A